MRRDFISVLIVAVVMIALSFSPCLAGDLQTQALRSLQESVLKKLPANRSLTRIAVLDFKGDDGTVKSAVTSILNERTGFKVMERADFDKILAEQGLQLKDIMDERTRIRHGRLKGVQGLLMGSVYASKAGFMSYGIKAAIRLVDVEKGEILLSREFEASAVSRWRRHVIIGSGVLGFLLLLALFFSGRSRRRRNREGMRFVEEGRGNAREMRNGVDRIIAHVSGAKSRLVESGKASGAVELKDIEKTLMAIRRTVTGKPCGGFRGGATDPFQTGLYAGGEIFWRLEDIERLSERVHNIASAGPSDDVDREINILRSAVSHVDRDLKNRLSQRPLQAF
jgi:hypothetical protein